MIEVFSILSLFRVSLAKIAIFLLQGFIMNIDRQKTLFIIDGSSFLYRAYYGLRPLHTATGEPVQAVYGFCKMIKKLIDTFDPQFIALVWDSKGKTTRHELFENYKATRQAPPSDLFEQKEWILKIADAIGLCQFSKQGVEADDLMYSLAKEWQDKGGNVIVVTSDKDMGQMITDTALLFDSFKDEMVDAQAFEKKMGFPVNKAAFYFALLGDASDNIPGVKGVGKKGALDLVNQFESLKNLYENLDKVTTNRTRTALEHNKENAFLSEKLFLLQYHPTTIAQDDLVFNAAHWANAQQLFAQLEFKSFLKDTGNVKTRPASSVKTAAQKGYQFITVTTEEQLHEIVKEVTARKLFAYDTEGDGLSPLNLNMVGISICYQEGQSFYIPCGHETTEPQLAREVVVKILKPLFENPAITSIAHNAKFDQLVLFHYGIKVQNKVFDTMLAVNLIKEEWQKASLKECSTYYLQEPMITFEQIVVDKKLPHFGYVSLQDATEYGAADAHQTFKLYGIFKKLLHEKGIEKLFYEVEMPTMQVLFEMEAAGIYCDVAVLDDLDKTVVEKLNQIKKTILDLIGPEFESINFNSPKQVEALLFEHLQLPKQKKSAKKTGYSTDYEVLVELAHLHPVPGYIAQYRELFKLKSTYIDALPEYINNQTGKIHTTYSQIRTATGRLSSSEPNLQNIPIEGLGSAVRAAFKPDKDRLFLSADYSQIELRVLAHLSRDEVLTNAFLKGRDIHAQTAAGLFNVSVDQVTSEQRTIGKRINFSILYGLTPYGLAQDLRIGHKEAKQYIDAYFNHYPKVRVWMDSVIAQAKKDEFVTTWLGRKRAVTQINERNHNLAELAKRIAINTVAQGTAAEIMKLGMIHVARKLKEERLDACVVLQIHDEILVSVAKDQVDQVKIVVKQELESVVNWKIPLIVDMATGLNWKELE